MSNLAHLLVLGVTFRTAPSETRELLVLDDDDVDGMLLAARERHPDAELVVVSTCDRTELWCGGGVAEDAARVALAALHARRPEAFLPGLKGCDPQRPCGPWEARRDDDAAHWIMRVVSGLESSIPGDAQIPGQIRAATRAAELRGAYGPALRTVVTRALRASRRARNETSISRDGAGVGSAVADLLDERLAARDQRSVALLGAGSVARAVARRLAKHRNTRVVVVNRRITRAQEIASLYGFETRPWNELPAVLATVHAAVAATAAPHPVLTDALLAPVAKARGERLLVVDAGFPRNVEPSTDTDVVSLADLAHRESEIHAARTRAVPFVERIIETELNAWRADVTSADLESLIGALYAESQRFIQASLDGLSPAERMATERRLRLSLRRMLHNHVTRLRTIAPTTRGA